MKEILSKQNKETRCYIMAAIMVFEGYKGIDDMTEINGEMTLDTLGLTRTDIESFPMPKNINQIVAHLRPITDSEVRHWVIGSIYAPVLQSRRKDAVRDFKLFCSALGWDTKEIKEEMKLTEDLLNITPVVDEKDNISSSKGSGCLSFIAFVVISTILCSFALFY